MEQAAGDGDTAITHQFQTQAQFSPFTTHPWQTDSEFGFLLPPVVPLGHSSQSSPIEA